MSATQRLGRWVLVAALGAMVGGAAPAVPAGAEDAAGDECVNGYLSRGRSVVVGPTYGIPFESVAGAPYVGNELNSKPQSFGVASNAHEGLVGDIVIGTSVPGAVPPNPTQAKAIWPPAAESSNGPSYRSDARTAYGPFAQSMAKAEPRKVMATAMMFGEPASPFGPARAVSEAVFDGTTLKGTESVVGYDFRLGPVTINMLRSTLEYASDGTESGSRVTWKLEFSGVGGDQDKVYTITQEGFAPQGGNPEGSEQMRQFNEGAKAFGDALEEAGIGRGYATIAPAEIEVRAGYIKVKAAGLELRGFPAVQRDKLFHQLGMVFGYHDRLVEVQLGPCEADVNEIEPVEYEQPADKSTTVGPITAPDLTPPGYGGPK